MINTSIVILHECAIVVLQCWYVFKIYRFRKIRLYLVNKITVYTPTYQIGICNFLVTSRYFWVRNYHTQLYHCHIVSILNFKRFLCLHVYTWIIHDTIDCNNNSNNYHRAIARIRVTNISYSFLLLTFLLDGQNKLKLNDPLQIRGIVLFFVLDDTLIVYRGSYAYTAITLLFIFTVVPYRVVGNGMTYSG